MVMYVIFIQKSLQPKDEVIYAEYTETSSKDNDEDILVEATSNTYIFRDALYAQIDTVLSNTTMDHKFKQLVGNFIDRNNSKLRTPGPQYMIPFKDSDKKAFYDILGIEEKEVLDLIVKITSNINSGKFVYLRQNPILWVFYFCIRHYMLKRDFSQNFGFVKVSFFCE